MQYPLTTGTIETALKENSLAAVVVVLPAADDSKLKNRYGSGSCCFKVNEP
ncbi:MAG: hypothetical protein IPL42_09580 [Saprospiraceae bacterium]|nr:hypothetical protein [Saprospiraceae bacterium]